jgi:hypothetical protein
MAVQSITTRLFPAGWEPLSRPRVSNLLWIIATAALVVAVWLLGRELVRIERLADDMRSVVMPQMVAQQKRAIWIESLRSAANIVVFASEAKTRQDALAKAEQLAGNVTLDERARQHVLAQASASIRRAARRSDEADRLDRQIRDMLGQANSLITDMNANLASIVDDSASTLERVVHEILQSGDESGFSRTVLEEVLDLNTTSQDLLAILDQGRVLLAAARTMETEAELQEAARYFEAIGASLRARVHTLRGNTDYERMPGRIERFVELVEVFDRRRQWLSARQDAMAASDRAKASLAVMRENLAADAAAVAEAGVADIAARASRSKLASAAALVALIVALGLVALRERWSRDLQVLEPDPAGRPACAAHRADLDAVTPELSAALTAVERFQKAHGNLEHLRRALPSKLSRLLSPPATPDASNAGPARSGDGSAGPTQGGAQRDPTAQADLPGVIAPLLDLVHEITDSSSKSALEGALTAMRVLQRAGARAEREPEPARAAERERASLIEARRSLEIAAALTEITSERIGAAIGEMNIAAGGPDPSAGAVAEAAPEGLLRRIDRLSADLAAVHAQTGRLSAGVG